MDRLTHVEYKKLIHVPSNKILRELFGRGRLSSASASMKMGRNRNFVNNYRTENRDIGLSVFAEVCEAAGVRLLLRNRATGEVEPIYPNGYEDRGKTASRIASERLSGIGERLREARENAGMSIDDAATEIGVSSHELGRIEAEKSAASLETVVAMLIAYGSDPRSVLGI